MIGFFPDPYPDELLYSVFLRYHQRTRYKYMASMMRDLLGKENVSPVVDLPGRLDHLIRVLPPGYCYSVDRIINENTMLPYYAPFLPPERVRMLRENITTGGEQGESIHIRIGILNSKIKLAFLRFCPKCVEEDRQLYGETYWHRAHQAPGLMVCFNHKMWLKKSEQPLSPLERPDKFLAANQIVSTNHGCLLDNVTN